MKKQYEGMFLFDAGFAGEIKNAEDEIQRLMSRADGEIILCRKWDERRLAYEIEGRKRGVYLLTYFLADPSRIKGLERDAQLSEHVLRLLVLRADSVTRERMEHYLPPEKKPEPRPESPAATAPTEAAPEPKSDEEPRGDEGESKESMVGASSSEPSQTDSES